MLTLLVVTSALSLNRFIKPSHRNVRSPRSIACGSIAFIRGNISTPALLDGPRFRTRRQVFQIGTLSATVAALSTVGPVVAVESAQDPTAADGEFLPPVATMLLRTLPNRSVDLLSIGAALEACAQLLRIDGGTDPIIVSNATWVDVEKITNKAIKILLAERLSPALEAPPSAWLDFFSGESRPGLAPYVRSEDSAAVVANRKRRSAMVSPTLLVLSRLSQYL